MEQNPEIIEYKRNKNKVIITISIVCAIIALIIVLNTLIIPALKKNNFIATYGQDVYDRFGLIEEGTYISFGAYEQDNNTSNGKEDIEWLVLEVKGGKVLVISKYGLDCKPYHNKHTTAITWQTCSLRKWLNNDFINIAFSADEKAMIPTITVSAHENTEYGTNPGQSTQDKVFLMSMIEAKKYFESDSARQCEPTDYAVANGCVPPPLGSCWWWLRSPGFYEGYATSVNLGGAIYDLGYFVCDINTTVRPALWIDLNS